jgi:hypothetical protein
VSVAQIYLRGPIDLQNPNKWLAPTGDVEHFGEELLTREKTHHAKWDANQDAGVLLCGV